MKKPLKEWMSYLFEGINNNFEENLQNIVQAARKDTRYNDTFQFINSNGYNKVAEIFESIGATKILSNYKIKKFLGAGAIGAAFELEEPHENYIMKIQISDYNVGTSAIINMYKQQEAGNFRPDEIRVLDLFEGKFSYVVNVNGYPMNKNYTLYIFIISKVAVKNVSGKKKGRAATPEEFLGDLYASGVTTLLEGIVDYNFRTPEQKKHQKEEGYSLRESVWQFEYFINHHGIETFLKLMKIAKHSTVENLAKAFYKIKESTISYCSRDQYIFLVKEYYRQILAAKKDGRRPDFHGGNFGFRPKSDIPLSFDV